jgi:hypothetical protein
MKRTPIGKSDGAYPAPALLVRSDGRPRMFPDRLSRSELLGRSSSYGGAIWSVVAGSTAGEGLVSGEGTGVLDGAGSAAAVGSGVGVATGDGATVGGFEHAARATAMTSVEARVTAIGR